MTISSWFFVETISAFYSH